jgi:hypothetical protein
MNLNQIQFTRKPATWDDVYTTVAGIDVPQGLPNYAAQDLGIERVPMQNFRRPVDGHQYFLVERANGETFLVNCEGYTYARYITKVM